MVLAAAGLREAGEARAAAGAAVGECCSVGEGRELGRAGGGSAGEREGERKRKRERERESAWLWLGLQPSEGGGDGRGRWEGLRSAWDTEPCAAARGPSSHRSLLGLAAPNLALYTLRGLVETAPNSPGAVQEEGAGLNVRVELESSSEASEGWEVPFLCPGLC